MIKAMRNPNAKHIDYGDFKGLISSNPNFVPSNVDGIAERNGRFLVMEWKRPNEKISTGQKILLQALAMTPRFTVIIINGNTDDQTLVNKFFKVTKDGCKPIGTGFEALKTYYLDWYGN